MDDDQQFCLRWNNHQSTLISVFDTLLENGTLVDCTLAAEGKFLKAHKVVLSACSPYFAALLSQQYDKHPIFILKDVKFQELRAMMDYMYRGEVNISQDQLAALLKAAESLQIKGLSDNRGSSSAAPSQQSKPPHSETSATKTLPPPVPANKASGLTIENKRPLKPELLDSDVSGSREGSTSPTSRKRKKIRRRSVDNNNLIDNHDQHSNSSSHSMHTSLQSQALALTSSSTVAGVPTSNNTATSLSSSSTAPSNSANVLTTPAAVAAAAAVALKKTDSVQQQQVAEALKLQLVKHQSQQQSQQQQQQSQQQQVHHTDDDERSGTEQGEGQGEPDSDDMDEAPQAKRHQPQATGVTVEGTDSKSINQSELMIEPKNEYDDGQDENVEDLTLDEEELLDDLDQAGPSHGGEGSSQGYAQWQMEREQNEAFMAAQDAVGGQHRDAQDKRSAKFPLVSNPKKIKTITVTVPTSPSSLQTTVQAVPVSTSAQLTQITQSTPVILNDLNECLLESKNIVVSKKDNKYILFTTAAVAQPQPPPLQPAQATLHPVQTTTVIDTTRIEELLKKDKIIKKTELQGDGTTTTTYIFDECDILPLKPVTKEMVPNSASMPTTVETISLASPQVGKPTTISIVKVASGDVVTTAGTAVIPVGTTLVPASASSTVSAINSSGAIINASTIQSNQSQIPSAKKLLKPTHPRIKYSKHKNPSAQSLAALPILTIPTVTTSQPIAVPIQDAAAGTTTKIELLNFSLSRKFPAHGQSAKTIDISNIQHIPITAVSKPMPTRYTVNEYETSTSNTSQSNDFTTGIIDDLDYSVIDDIELPDDVQVNFGDSYQAKSSHGGEIDDDVNDSQDQTKTASQAKKLIKSDAKILNTSMDEKYALLANTNIMKNFEYTVNESVVSDNDDGEMRQYICRHCGKRYRWKSTLRRHENVECGGKEAMHQCPYCTYKAKQRGNLGVHIRKHHADMPQLESRRKSKNRDSLSLIDAIKPESMEGQT
ncbi:longitudinals lacking protein, isoforms N/O/W/X/Y isoform X1 [Sabethes cyaneus]|uniref:longitudinals lacking protein, isoforms N/O/W/X/Y isoform X1 n=1 Tax=Sabethes cyaneus TaxID=53552 RepID=UPI00221E309C|nr:longitudinals lacking protein, isoforms N/O/W/X/Y isoform X1 [Sabethes cyaneus]XP_053683021.1 longitudinals lacking protein, isoforms N/O/W/X/Y isoform X1 [Sabethes cyaneus]XP_053683022.1 longitudinals lacking protein, isoforms N/O/W/X/Y isoform X1 [Sabethes cyaneus]